MKKYILTLISILVYSFSYSQTGFIVELGTGAFNHTICDANASFNVKVFYSGFTTSTTVKLQRSNAAGNFSGANAVNIGSSTNIGGGGPLASGSFIFPVTFAGAGVGVGYKIRFTDNTASTVYNVTDTAIIVGIAPTVSAGTDFTKGCTVNPSGHAIGEANDPLASYSWSPATGLSSSTVSNPTANPALSTTYTLTKTIILTQCSATATVVATVNTTLPTANAGTAFTKTCTSNASGAVIGEANNATSTYSWSPSSGLSSSTVSNPTANPTTTTTYTVVETTAATGCSASATVIVTVNVSPPSVSAGSAFTKTCISNTSGAAIGETNDPTSTYSWSPSAGLSSSTVSNPTANPAVTTTYTVTKTKTSSSCTATATVIVTVNNTPPSVSAGSAFTKTCVSNTSGAAIGEANVSGNTYSWNPSVGLSSSTVSNPTANPGVTTTYTVTKTNTATGCFATASVIVTVSTTPPTATISSVTETSGITNNDGITCSGGTAVLNTSGSTAGSGSISGYAWAPSIGATTSTVSVNPTSTTTYTVVITNSNGCTASDNQVVTVNPNPTINVNSPTICNGSSTNLNASGGTTYSWSPSLGLNQTTGATVSANPTSTSTFTVTGTNSNGCIGTNTSVVTINTPVADAGLDKSICNGSSIQLGSTALTGYTYSWISNPVSSVTAVSNPTVSPTTTATINSNTTYTVTATRTVNSVQCPATDIAVVTVYPVPHVSVTNNTPFICDSTSVSIALSNNLSGSLATNVSYNWTSSAASGYLVSPSNGTTTNTIQNVFIKNVDDTQPYPVQFKIIPHLIILSLNCFSNSNADSVIVNVLPTVSFNPLSDKLKEGCAGAGSPQFNFSVGVVAPFDQNIRYNWDTISTLNVTAPADYFKGSSGTIGGVLPAGSSINTIVNNFQPEDTGFVKFIITPYYMFNNDNDSCEGKPFTTRLRVLPSPPPVEVVGPTSVCNNQTNLIYNIVDPIQTLFYSWVTNPGSQVGYFEDYTVGNTPDSSNAIIQFAPPFSNPLNVIVRSKYPLYGCPSQQNIVINVETSSAPELRDVILFTTNPLIKLAVTYTDNGPQQYKWFSINKNLDINSISAVIGTEQTLVFTDSASFDTTNVFYFVEYSDDGNCWQRAFYNTPPAGSTLTSVKKLVAVKKEFEIYPNPASDNFIISFTGKDEVGVLEIISLTGNIIEHINVNHTKNIVINNEGNYSKGIYLVRYINSNGISQSHKLIIQ